MTTMAQVAQGSHAEDASGAIFLYRGVVCAGAAGAQTCRCGCSSEMLLLVLLACLASVSAASNSTKNVTTEAPPASTTNKEILTASETGDPSKVEIVKQIRRLNEDGSYTIGYEADDGTFKIESRDVLGNVKGTFGYIDKDGDIKRVTYSSSSDSTPTVVPVTSTTTPSPPAMLVRVNKTVSSTTRRPEERRPLPTVVYPSRSSYTTRGTVIQPIPRRRSGARTTTTTETTTERPKPEETTSNILDLYKTKVEENTKMRTQVLKPMPASVNDDLITRQTTTKLPVTLKPVYEHVTDKRQESDANKANTIRRELSGTSNNPRMVSLQQSVGDDSTDVYGSHLSLGTVRPLFTTTTPRARLVPIHSLVAARQRIQQQYQDESNDDQETTLEASTGRVFDRESGVTSNPAPVVHIPAPREHEDQLYHQQPIYRRPSPTVQFRTREYLRDNPGAPVPIGNQRPFLQYEYQNKVLEPQFIRETTPVPQPKSAEAVTQEPYDGRQVTRIIPVPVDERGVPLQGYQGRFVNPYRQPQQVMFQPRYNQMDEMYQISAPVSTRDLRKLLQILILRQNRLQGLMDQMMPGPYQPLYRPEDYRYQRRHYDDDYDYRYEPREVYSNQVSSYENPPYESQRYVPRRRLYSRHYDTVGSSSNRIDDTPEFLPPEIREALLLKMLVLAINPDFLPTPAPPTELTTAAPPRKQVRNVQILGEEGSMDEAKRASQRQ